MSHIVFRTDASQAIGTGHFMRSFNLAGVLIERGAKVSFMTAELPDYLTAFLEQKQIKRFLLTSPFSSEEVRGFLQNLDTKPEWIVVDHYQLDETWEETVKPWVKKIAVIDDLVNRRHDCDLLIDPNFRKDGKAVYQQLIPHSCKLLLGPRFALLSPKFASTRKQMSQRHKEIKEILISFGGPDPVNETEKVLSAIAGIDCQVNVIVGKLNTNLSNIENKLKKFENARLYVQTDRMAELMAASDLAVGAGGTELWERCCLGLPSIVIATNSNQKEQLEGLAKAGAVFYLGLHGEVSEERIAHAVNTLKLDSQWLNRACLSAMGLVDGKGVQRIASWLLKQNLTIRRVIQSDERRIFEWRNAPEVRNFSFDREPLTQEEHRKWLKKTLASKNCILLIVEDQTEAVAVLRYDLSKLNAIVSIYLVPDHYGRGYGPVVLQVGNEWLAQKYPEIDTVTAKVLVINKVSELAFLEAGFEYDHTELVKNEKTLYLNYNLKRQALKQKDKLSYVSGYH